MRKLIALVSLLAISASPLALADTLMIEKVSSDAATAAQRPSRGMTMKQVAARYGEPAQKLPAVGNPPITRWVYDDYTVYFEHDKVLHSVAQR
jgi:hypothetical protein